MTLRRDSIRGAARSRALAWAPPTLTSPTTYTINDATRRITLSAGQDAIIQLPNTPVSDYTGIGGRDALIHVSGGRHAVLIGGQVTALDTPTTTVSAPVGAADTTITVTSTAAFSAPGIVRIDGEAISYTGLTGTTFTGCTRNAGFFNTSPTSSNTTHAVGALVYVAENARQAITFESMTGTVHIEGVLLDGFLNDGIRFLSMVAGSTAQIQNVRIGPVRAYDESYGIDGHSDAIQLVGSPDTLRMDRATLMARNGRCLLNKGSDNSRVLVTGNLRDVELIGTGGHDFLLSNNDTATVWTTENCWQRPASNGQPVSSTVASLFGTLPPGESSTDFVPASSVGIGYVSPGYLP